MNMQGVIVGLIVIACSAYALWTLMPAAVRRGLSTRLLKLPLPDAIARPFRQAVQPTSGCGGCDNCGDTTPATPKSSIKPLVFHRRASR